MDENKTTEEALSEENAPEEVEEERPERDEKELRKKNILVFIIIIVVGICAAIVVPKIQAYFDFESLKFSISNASSTAKLLLSGLTK
jgi:hypothetical protein